MARHCRIRAFNGCARESCPRVPHRNSARTRPQSARGPPPAPPLQDIPPPPPPPSGSGGGGPPQQVFWTRRNILATLLVGSGLWYWRNYDALDPHVTFISRDSTPNGMQLMVSPTGEPYGITMVPTKSGDTHMLMLDAYGNMYYDPNDRSLGIYIVDRDANLVNAYVSPTRPGRVELEKIGNLADIKRIPIEGIADIQLQEDGKVMWAFGDETEPLAINPLALVQKDAEGNILGAAFPGQVNEGIIKVVKENKSLFGMFRKEESAFGGPLQPDY